MTRIQIAVAGYTLMAQMEEENASQTCAEFKKLLPYRQKLIHARWSGESCWIPLGDFKLDVSFEHHTSYPAPGEILFYPGGYSETEILFPYGPTNFGTKMGQVAGNHFLTVVEGREHLRTIGEKVLWEGAQEIAFTAI
ncbi:MAG: DUF3830 family protein [Chloroflexota bacterium]